MDDTDGSGWLAFEELDLTVRHCLRDYYGFHIFRYCFICYRSPIPQSRIIHLCMSKCQ